MCSCPPPHCEVVYSAVVRLIERLLQAGVRNAWLEEPITNLQGQITDTLNRLLQPTPDGKVSLSLVPRLDRVQAEYSA